MKTLNKGSVSTVLLLTDGIPTVGIKDKAAIKQEMLKVIAPEGGKVVSSSMVIMLVAFNHINRALLQYNYI